MMEQMANSNIAKHRWVAPHFAKCASVCVGAQQPSDKPTHVAAMRSILDVHEQCVVSDVRCKLRDAVDAIYAMQCKLCVL